MKEIKKEEAEYVPLPKFYTFKSRDARERILYANFLQVNKDVKEMIDEIFARLHLQTQVENDYLGILY